MRSLFSCVIFILCLCGPSVADPSQFKGWVFYEDGPESNQSLIVRNTKELEAFRKRIPKRVPSKRPPAPDNKDPLLLPGAVDFGKYILVLALRGETISTHPVHLSTDTQKDQIVVWFESPEPPPEARPYGWGVYRGVLLPKTAAPIVVKFD